MRNNELALENKETRKRIRSLVVIKRKLHIAVLGAERVVPRVEFRSFGLKRLREREFARERTRAAKRGLRSRARDSRQIEVGLVARHELTYKLPDGYLKRTSVHYPT